MLVVTQLATAAGKAVTAGYQGAGITAYTNAQLIWGMPQAIITVSVMAALLPRISRAAARRRHRRGPRRHLPGPAHLRRRDRPGRLRASSPSASRCAPCCTRPAAPRPPGQHGLHPDGLRPRPDPVLRAVRRPARLLRLRGHPHALLQHGHRRRGQRRRLRPLLSWSCPPAGPWSAWPPPTAWPTRSASGVAWQRLRNRLGGDLDGAPCRAHLRPAVRRRDPRRARRRGRGATASRRPWAAAPSVRWPR